MLKKWYEKEPVWFAVGWILLYVLVFSNADQLSEALGLPKLITVIAGLVLSLLLWRFIKQNGLSAHLGLTKVEGDLRKHLYFIPLLLISTVNFWNGLTLQTLPLETLCYILSMCFVAFLEEAIFRGLVFRGLCRENIKTAILISSLTFGVGHIVNLLLGEPVLDTLLQLVYASAIGFCYTAVCLSSGSILPCILSHALVNCTSVFAREPSPGGAVAIALVETLLAAGYGLWLLRGVWKESDLTAEIPLSL